MVVDRRYDLHAIYLQPISAILWNAIRSKPLGLTVMPLGDRLDVTLSLHLCWKSTRQLGTKSDSKAFWGEVAISCRKGLRGTALIMKSGPTCGPNHR
jgi:hypothetical protein